MRSRSFLFIAFGAAAAMGLPARCDLHVPENGLIALNVPLDPLRLGALSTRTTHPYYLARWNDLLGLLSVETRVVNPYWAKTKGEMVAACADQLLLRDVVPRSMSCASPAKARWQGRPSEHCGYCVPCVIRRAALEGAWGRRKDPTKYTLSALAAGPLDTRSAHGEQIRSFQLAAARLESQPGVERLLIHKPGSLGDVPERLGELAAVYRRGMTEVAALLARAKTRPR